MATQIVSHSFASVVPNALPSMNIRPAQHHAPGVRTFYVASNSHAGTEYAVQHIRKSGMNRWQCSCPQFFYRCAAKRRHCKHIHFVRNGSAV